MAVTLTKLSETSNYGSASILPSFTSVSGQPLLLSIVRRRNDIPTSITTTHGTFQLVDSVFGGNRLVAIYATIANGATGSITLSYPSSGTNTVAAIQCDGCDGSSVANAIPQSNTASQYNGGGGSHTITVPLTTFGSSTNAAFIVGLTSGTTTGEAGYTEIPVTGSLQSAFYKLSEDTTPNYNTTLNFQTVRAVAIEIAEGGSPSTNNLDVSITTNKPTVLSSIFNSDGTNQLNALIVVYKPVVTSNIDNTPQTNSINVGVTLNKPTVLSSVDNTVINNDLSVLINANKPSVFSSVNNTASQNSLQVSIAPNKPTVLTSITNTPVENQLSVNATVNKPVVLSNVQNGLVIVEYSDKTNYTQSYLSTSYKQQDLLTNYTQVNLSTNYTQGE